jgi:hypothetical protein
MLTWLIEETISNIIYSSPSLGGSLGIQPLWFLTHLSPYLSEWSTRDSLTPSKSKLKWVISHEGKRRISQGWRCKPNYREQREKCTGFIEAELATGPIAKRNNNTELLAELVAMSSGSYTNVDNTPSEWICKATLVQREFADKTLIDSYSSGRNFLSYIAPSFWNRKTK